MKSGLLEMQDLVPNTGDLMQAAYGALVGDRAFISWGVHKGRNPDRLDTMGLTKIRVYDAAVQGDVDFFTGLHATLTADPWHFPPSLRTLISKDPDNPDKGTRPIDDPCELKRLVTICVRHVIESRAEGSMHPGQYGGRPNWAIKPACSRPGATMQDHVATAIWQGMREGYRHVLALDLKDAFGLVPEQAAITVLKALGLDEQAAQWIWRLCKIDAVNARRRSIRYTRQGRGIEQGNVLSAMVMNLVLAPLFRRLDSRLDVRVVSYLDDVYVLARTPETAREAFYTFRQSARARGFTNVRRLREEGDPTDSKNSVIINIVNQPVTVLKTYEVDALGISLHPGKVVELKSEGRLTGKVTISTFRKISDCRSLTKGACRLRNSDAIQPAPMKPVTAPCSSISSSDGEPQGTLLPSNPPWIMKVRDESVRKTVSLGNPGYVSLTIGIQKLKSPDLHDIKIEKLRTSDESLPSLSTTIPLCECVMPSRCKQADGIPGNDRDSYQTAGGQTLDRSGNRAEDRPRYLSVHSPEIQLYLTRPGRFVVGDRFKGAIVDLRNLTQVIGDDVPEGTIVQIINKMIRLVRVNNRAAVLIGPRESWTAITGIIGNDGDPTYRRTGYEFQTDGSVKIELVHRTRRQKPPSLPAAPSEAPVVIRSIRVVNRALNCHKVEVTVEGRRFTGCYNATSPNEMAGILETIAYILKIFPLWIVAVPCQMAPILADHERMEPCNVGIRLALNSVLRNRTWSRSGEEWLLGLSKNKV